MKRVLESRGFPPGRSPIHPVQADLRVRGRAVGCFSPLFRQRGQRRHPELGDRVPARIIWSTDGTAVTAHSTRNLVRRPIIDRTSCDSGMSPRKAALVGRRLGCGCGRRHGGRQAAGRLHGRGCAARDAATGAIIQKWETDLFPPALAFSPDGKSMAPAAAWITAPRVPGASRFATSHAATLRGRSKLTGRRHSSLILPMASSSRRHRTAGRSDCGTPRPANWPESSRTKLAFSPDGRTIACTSMEVGDKKLLAKVDLYDLESAALVKSLVSEDGNELAVNRRVFAERSSAGRS